MSNSLSQFQVDNIPICNREKKIKIYKNIKRISSQPWES